MQEKKKAYLRYLENRSTENLVNYKKHTAIVKKEIRKLKRESWENFVSHIEHDIHGRQVKAYKILKKLDRNENDDLRLNPMPEKEWLDYYGNLWTNQEHQIIKQQQRI